MLHGAVAQASKGGGIDAIAFVPAPIRGAKIDLREAKKILAQQQV